MQSFFFWANEKNIFNFCLFPFFAKLNSAQLKLQLQLELSIALIAKLNSAQLNFNFQLELSIALISFFLNHPPTRPPGQVV